MCKAKRTARGLSWAMGTILLCSLPACQKDEPRVLPDVSINYPPLPDPTGPGSILVTDTSNPIPFIAGYMKSSERVGLLSVPRWLMTAVSLDSNIYFIGGNESAATMDIFDTRTSTVTTRKTLKSGLYMKAVVSGREIIICGGDDPSVEIYQVDAGISTLHRLSEDREGITLAVVGNWVVFAGGFTIDRDGNPMPSSRVDLFNTVTRQWSQAALSEPRMQMGVAVSNKNLLVLAGGLDRKSASRRVDIFNSTTGKWSGGRDLPETDWNMTGVTIRDSAFFFSLQRSEMLAYQPDANQFKVVNVPFVKTLEPTVATGEDEVLFLGGLKAWSPDMSAILYRFQGETRSFNLNFVYTDGALIKLGKYYYLAGGNYEPTNVTLRSIVRVAFE